MENEIIKKFQNKFNYCFNVGVTPDDITKEEIEQFILSELKALKEECLFGEYRFKKVTKLDSDLPEDFKTYIRQDKIIEAFAKRGV